MKCELSDVQAGFRKGRGTRDQIANIHWIIKKARVSEKHLLLLYWLYGSPQTRKILKEMGTLDHLTCLLRNLYSGQDATVRTRHRPTHWFQIEKRVLQGSVLSPCLCNLYAEHIMWNVRLDEAQVGVKISGRNISNLRYAEDTILMMKKN